MRRRPDISTQRLRFAIRLQIHQRVYLLPLRKCHSGMLTLVHWKNLVKVRGRAPGPHSTDRNFTPPITLSHLCSACCGKTESMSSVFCRMNDHRFVLEISKKIAPPTVNARNVNRGRVVGTVEIRRRHKFRRAPIHFGEIKGVKSPLLSIPPQ